MSISPGSQTVSSGATASWTVVITNTGGAYLYAVGLTDGAAPSCDPPAADSDSLSFMAPNLAISYTCSLSNVTASLTNTVNVIATTAPGPQIAESASTTGTVQQAAFTPPSAPVSAAPNHVTATAPAYATLLVTGLKSILLDTKNRSCRFRSISSTATTLVLSLLDSKGHMLAAWVEHAKSGSHSLGLLLPLKARHKGRDTLRIRETRNSKPKLLSVTLRA